MLSAVAIMLYPCILKILTAKLQEIRKCAKHITKKAKKCVETPNYDVSININPLSFNELYYFAS